MLLISWCEKTKKKDVEFSLLSLFRPRDRAAASRDELHIRKMKLNYQEVGQCSKDAQALWERKLTAPGRMTVPQDKEEMYRALCQGEKIGVCEGERGCEDEDGFVYL